MVFCAEMVGDVTNTETIGLCTSTCFYCNCVHSFMSVFVSDWSSHFPSNVTMLHKVPLSKPQQSNVSERSTKVATGNRGGPVKVTYSGRHVKICWLHRKAVEGVLFFFLIEPDYFTKRAIEAYQCYSCVSWAPYPAPAPCEHRPCMYPNLSYFLAQNSCNRTTCLVCEYLQLGYWKR